MSPTGSPTGPRRPTWPTRAISTTPSPCSSRCPAGASRSTGARLIAIRRTPRAAYIELVERALEVPVTLGRHGRGARAGARALVGRLAHDPLNLVTYGRVSADRIARSSSIALPTSPGSILASSIRSAVSGPRRMRRRARPGGHRPGSAPRSRRTPRQGRRPDPRRARLRAPPVGLHSCRSSPGSVAMTRSCAGSMSCKPAQQTRPP